MHDHQLAIADDGRPLLSPLTPHVILVKVACGSNIYTKTLSPSLSYISNAYHSL